MAEPIINWADELTKPAAAPPQQATLVSGPQAAQSSQPSINWADELTRTSSPNAAPAAAAAPQPKQFDIDFSRPVAQVRADVARLPEADRADALKQWADVYVAGERKGGGLGQSVADRARNVSQGAFFGLGSYADELDAGTQGIIHKVTGGAAGAPYDETKAYHDAKNRAINSEAQHLFTLPTKAASMGLLPDVPVSSADVARVVGGGLNARSMPGVNVMKGEALLPAAVNTTATGATYGALAGAGEGNTAAERGSNALWGAGIGGALGAVTQPIIRGVANAATGVKNALTPKPAELRGYSSRAVANVTDAARNDSLFQLGRNSYEAQAGRLGPEGTLADMGPSLVAETGGVASLPGAGKSLINETLGRIDRPMEGRRGGAAERIKADADLVLGPPQNLIELEQQARKIGSANAEPFYKEFYATEIKPTENLVALLQRLPPGAWEKAKTLATAEGVDLAKTINTGYGIDLIKRGMDDFIKDLPKGTNAERIFAKLQKRMIGEVDSILSPRNPDASSWAIARKESGDWIRFRKGVEAGQEAFKKGTHPDQMKADLAKADANFRSGYEIGARGEVRDIIGNSATNFGPNGDSAARRALGSEYAREKLGTITDRTPLQRTGEPVTATNRATGEQTSYTRAPAEQLTNRLDTESVFEATRQKALGNSVTAERTAAQKRYAAPGDNAQHLPDSSAYGDAKKVATYVANKLTGNFIKERALAQASDAAEMLMAQGMRRDEIARALRDHARSQDVSEEVRRALIAVGYSLMSGARTGTIDAITRTER